jgi:hypothetical protein
MRVLKERSERVGFEPTWLAPIRFRGGAVMTASVPLLISKWHFSNKSRLVLLPTRRAPTNLTIGGGKAFPLYVNVFGPA